MLFTAEIGTLFLLKNSRKLGCMLTCGDDMIRNIGYIFATCQALFSALYMHFPFNSTTTS